MQVRCPEARFFKTAFLPEYALAFTRFSSKRACGVADVVPCKGQRVYGVVYELPEHDLCALDGFEGYYGPGQNNHYQRVLKTVMADTPLRVWLYEVMHKAFTPQVSNRAYLAHLIQGAKHHELPEAYQQQLRVIPVCD